MCREGSRLASRLRPAPPLGPRLRPPPRPRRPRPARASRFPGAAYEARQNGPRGPASAAVRWASGRGLPRSHRAAPAPPARAAPAGPLGPPDPGERPRLSPSTPRAFPERFRPSRFRAHAAFGSGFAPPSPALGAHRPRLTAPPFSPDTARAAGTCESGAAACAGGVLLLTPRAVWSLADGFLSGLRPSPLREG